MEEKIRTSVDDRILGNNTILGRVSLDDLELHGSHSTTNEESVTFAKGSKC